MLKLRDASRIDGIQRQLVMVLALGLASLVLATPLHAQRAVGSILGAVKDPSGAAVPNATVTIVSRATGQRIAVTSSHTGEYIVSDLLPGYYDIVAEAQGFKKTSVENVELRVQQEARIDVQLQVGAVTQSVEVAGQAALLQTEEASVGTVIDSTRVVQLPLNGRGFLQLAFLSAGTAITAGNGRISTDRATVNGDAGISIGGQREMSNVFLLDGTTNTDRNYNMFAIGPSVDAIQEFKVQVNNYSAEFGGQSGGQINIVTKSGSNSLHGSAWGFFRNQRFDARNFFAPPGPIAPFDRQQFGAAAGGKIIRDKLFYFGDYEGLYQNQAQTALNPTPNAAIRSGDYSNYRDGNGKLQVIYDPQSTVPCATCVTGYTRTPFNGNVVPPNRINSVSKALLQYIDLPNQSTTLPFGGGYYLNQNPRHDRQDQTIDRIDYLISASDRLFGRYAFDKEYALVPGMFSSQGSSSNPKVENLTVSESHSFGANKINDFRFGYLRFRNFKLPSLFANKTDIIAPLNITNSASIMSDPTRWGVPSIYGSQYTWGDGGTLSTQRNNSFEYLDTFSWVKGRHTLKFGGDMVRDQLNNKTWLFPTGGLGFYNYYTNLPDDGGASTGAAMAQYLLGESNSQNVPYGNPQLYMRRWTFAYYFADEFRATSNLTLNFGLRYEYIQPWVEKYNNFSNTVFFQAFGGPTPRIERAGDYVYAMGGSATTPVKVDPVTGLPCTTCAKVSRGIINPVKTNFMPRFGFAYRPFGSNKWVIRGGAGLFYDLQIGNTIVDYARNWPQQFANYFNDPQAPYFPSQTISVYTVTPPGNVPQGGWGTTINFPRPHIANYNLAVQRQLGSNTTVTLEYIGSQSRKLNISVGTNQTVSNADACKLYPSVCAANNGIVPVAQRVVWTDPNVYWCCQTSFPMVNARYNSGILSLERRMATGLTLMTSFAWSRSEDNGHDIRGSGTADSEPNNPYAFNNGSWWGPSNFDQTERFVNSWVYDLPFGRGKKFGGGMSRLADVAVGEWSFNGIYTVSRGLPMTVYDFGNIFTYTPNQLSDPNLPRGKRTVSEWFNPNVFQNVGVNQGYGTFPRNSIRAPGVNNWDLGIFKNFPISERWGTIQFRAEFFNAFNHPAFGFPGFGFPSPTLGAITSTNPGIPSREIQLAVRYHW